MLVWTIHKNFHSRTVYIFC